MEQMPKQAPRGTDKKPKIVTRWDVVPRAGFGVIAIFWRRIDRASAHQRPCVDFAVEAILAEIGLAVFIADRHMSALEGSLSFLPRRVLVAADAAAPARRALAEAGLGAELRDG
jgi:hypothetical protein